MNRAKFVLLVTTFMIGLLAGCYPPTQMRCVVLNDKPYVTATTTDSDIGDMQLHPCPNCACKEPAK